MNDDDLTPEPGFLQDWNTIHLRDSQIIFDLPSGIEYAYSESDDGEIAALYIYQVGSDRRSRTTPFYEDKQAKEFWRQLLIRIAM